MKKVLFVLFFPITIPIYLIIKLFFLIRDVFIPFMADKVVPFINAHISSKTKESIESKTNEIQNEPKVENYGINPQGQTEFTSVAYRENVKHGVIRQGKDILSEDIANQSFESTVLSEPPVDYMPFMARGSTESESLLIGAMAVCAYEQTISVSLLQRRLKIGYGQASLLIEKLKRKNYISPMWNGTYRSLISKDDLQYILQQIEANNHFKAIHGFSPDKTENLYQQYSIEYDDIEYKKDSKIVSIFTKKWREICRNEFIALDFETTGLNYKSDRIIEVAAIKYIDGIETDKYVTLVNPLIRIPSDATRVNHITDEMVAEAPTERSVVPQLIEFLGDSLIVGHNVNFDLSFLEVAAQRYGYNVQYNYIDTLSVSKKLFRNLQNYKLGTIADALHINTGALHRAEADVRVCAEIINIALNSLIDD